VLKPPDCVADTFDDKKSEKGGPRGGEDDFRRLSCGSGHQHRFRQKIQERSPQQQAGANCKQ
jgi:hypothetical protein